MRRFALIALLTLAACRTAGDAPEQSTAGWVRHVPSIGWRDLPGYSLAVPAGLKRLHAQGIDSDVASFEGEGLRLMLDYGMYSGLPSCGAAARCSKEALTIDGRSVQAVSIEGGANEQPYPLSFHVEIPVQPQLFEIGTQFKPAVDLAMHAHCADAAACRTARAIAGTIKFGKYAQATPQPPPPVPPPQEEPLSPPKPEPEPLCMRVNERQARSFEGLQLMSAIGGTRVYGRKGEMFCAAPAEGRGRCEVRGRSQIRIEFPTGASGFRTSGAELALFEFGPSTFSCRPKSAG